MEKDNPFFPLISRKAQLRITIHEQSSFRDPWIQSSGSLITSIFVSLRVFFTWIRPDSTSAVGWEPWHTLGFSDIPWLSWTTEPSTMWINILFFCFNLAVSYIWCPLVLGEIRNNHLFCFSLIFLLLLFLTYFI